MTYWPVLPEEGQPARNRSGLLSDAQAAQIREAIPFGPPYEPYAKVLAEQFGCNYLTVCNIGAGLSYKRPQACPPDHPLRLAINEHNAERQRIRAQVTPQMRKEIGARQEWRCVYCFQDISKRASPDHIIPLEQGGDSSLENVQLTCLRCNRSKATLADAEYRVKINRIQRALHRKDLRAVNLGFESHDDINQKLNEVLGPAVGSLLWSDSTGARCPWCQEATKPIGEHDDFWVGSPDAAVFRCATCKRMFCVANWRGLKQFQEELGWVIQGYDYADEDVEDVVKAVGGGDSTKAINLLASLAGDIREVKKRRHRHKSDDACWCEFGGSPFVEVGEAYKQTGILSETEG